MAKKREVVGGEYVVRGGKTRYVPVYKEEAVDTNLIEEKIIVPVKEKKQESTIVVGATYRQYGINKQILVDTSTGQVVMNPGTPFFYWILGILWDNRFLRRGRDNLTYKLNIIRAIESYWMQYIYQGFRGIFIYCVYDSYLESLKWSDNYNHLYLMWSGIIAFVLLQYHGMSSDKMYEQLGVDRCRISGLQAAVNNEVK